MTPATRGKQSSSPWRSGCASTRGRTGGFPFLRARSASERPRWPAAPTRPSTPRRPRSFGCGTPLRSLQPSSGTPPSSLTRSCARGARERARARRVARGQRRRGGRRLCKAPCGARRERQGGGAAAAPWLALRLHLRRHAPRPDGAPALAQLGSRQRARRHSGLLAAHCRRRPRLHAGVGQPPLGASLGEGHRGCLHAVGGPAAPQRAPLGAPHAPARLRGPLPRLPSSRAVWDGARVRRRDVCHRRLRRAAALLR
mmetsp:Transcript_10710/g.31908  ORF Transcript_10710/g.31908 Transcript_10710/m.31908 type:complete len:256 (+) Transcript_10710:308-1075(+)